MIASYSPYFLYGQGLPQYGIVRLQAGVAYEYGAVPESAVLIDNRIVITGAGKNEEAGPSFGFADVYDGQDLLALGTTSTMRFKADAISEYTERHHDLGSEMLYAEQIVLSRAGRQNPAILIHHSSRDMGGQLADRIVDTIELTLPVGVSQYELTTTAVVRDDAQDTLLRFLHLLKPEGQAFQLMLSTYGKPSSGQYERVGLQILEYRGSRSGVSLLAAHTDGDLLSAVYREIQPGRSFSPFNPRHNYQ